MAEREPTRRELLRELLRGLGRAIAFAGAATALRPSGALAQVVMAGTRRHAQEGAAASSLRVGVVLGSAATSLRAGVELGAEEAARAASLLGGEAALVQAAAPEAESDPAAAARRLVERHGVQAIIGGDDDASAAVLATAAEALAVPFLNVGARSDALRRTVRCTGGFTFHVEASARMYDDAISHAPEGAAVGRVVLWHESLERYGAGQLNDRFRARFGRGMDGPAWAGWFAVKALWEGAARGAGDGAALARALRAARLDGHKGRRLSFRAWDGQLRQPLYLLPREGGAREPLTGLLEVPPAPRGARVDTDDLLDRLGAPAPGRGCPGGAR